MKFKVDMQGTAPPPRWDELRTISHDRLMTVNREEIEDFIAWPDRFHEGKEGDAKDYFPLLHIQSHASWNESTAGSTGTRLRHGWHSEPVDPEWPVIESSSKNGKGGTRNVSREG